MNDQVIRKYIFYAIIFNAARRPMSPKFLMWFRQQKQADRSRSAFIGEFRQDVGAFAPAADGHATFDLVGTGRGHSVSEVLAVADERS
jgi:hypothetical protein